MAYTSARDLKEDVLFRGGEPSSGSDWDSRVIDYLNRVYRSLAIGASEFLPELVEDWWWMRGKASLMLDPIYDTGTVSVTNGSTTITFSNEDTTKTGWHLKVDGWPDIFKATYSGSAWSLDEEYTGDTNATASFELMHLEYDLDSAATTIMSPMTGYRNNQIVAGMLPERMDQLYPLADAQSGEPEAFSMEDENTVRFSHGGRTDGVTMRLDYRYKPVITALTDATDSIPLVPIHYRHVLADMALSHLFVDKNDTRAETAVSSARATLLAMFKENRRRLAKMNDRAGWIIPRVGRAPYNSKLLRTESGLIIGW